MKQLILILSLLLLSISSFAEFNGYKKVEEKAEKKQKSGWSLDEWLAQRDRSRMMDLWLAMNTSEDSEFYLSYNQLSYTASQNPAGSFTDSNYTTSFASFGAYSTIIGLNFDYSDNREENSTDLAGSLRVRVFGNADQATNLTFGFGQRTLSKDSKTLKFLFPEVQLNLHFLSSFGVHGLYQQFLPVSHDFFGDVEGTRTEYGLFLDFKMLRIFGNYYEDFMISNPSGIQTTSKRAGIASGLKIYF